jgi:hypothetical protein
MPLSRRWATVAKRRAGERVTAVRCSARGREIQPVAVYGQARPFPESRSAMTGYQVGILFHLIGVILFFAGAAVAGVATYAARRQDQPAAIAMVLGVARPGAVMLATGGVLLLLAGFYLSGEINGFGQRWLESSILLFVVSLIAGAWGGRRSRATREYAVGLAERNEGDAPTLRAMLDDRLTTTLHWVAAITATVVLVLMVWQPGA